MDYNLQQQLMMNGMMLVKDTDDGDSQASSRKSRDPSRSRKRHRHRRHRSRSGGRRRSNSRRGSKDRDRKRRSHHNSGLSVLPDDEGHEEDEDGDHEMPDADWQCGVCSNLNSVQREECFRCSATFSQSKRTSPTCELSVRHAPDSLHEDDVVQAIRSAVSGVGENVEIVKAVRRRSTIYVRLETARHATMVLVACRCHITCEGSEHLIMFSSDNYTRPSSRHNTAVVGGKVGEQQQQEAPPPGMPRDLWPQHWKQPSEFGGAEEEKSYLALMSEHWQHLSAAQKSYYDGRIALALQSRKPQQAEANTLPSSSQQPQPQAAGTTAAAAARPPPPAPSSSLEDIKRRLAEKKNAMKSAEGQAAPASPSSTTTAAVNSAAASKNPEKSSADTISQLKQRLAMKKAQLPQQQQQQQQSADQQTTAQAKSQTEQQAPTTTGAIALYGGFPIPPCVDPSKMLASPMMLRCVPSMTVERLVPPAARTW